MERRAAQREEEEALTHHPLRAGTGCKNNRTPPSRSTSQPATLPHHQFAVISPAVSMKGKRDGTQASLGEILASGGLRDTRGSSLKSRYQRLCVNLLGTQERATEFSVSDCLECPPANGASCLLGVPAKVKTVTLLSVTPEDLAALQTCVDNSGSVFPKAHFSIYKRQGLTNPRPNVLSSQKSEVTFRIGKSFSIFRSSE